MKKITIFKIKNAETNKTINIGTSTNICLMCGKPDIPEGTEICYQCEKKHSENI